MKLLAIDPGSSGGIAWIDPDGIVHAESMPDTEADVHQFLRDRKFLDGCAVLVIEDLPKFAGKLVPSSSIFTMARGFGFILGVATAMGFCIRLVRPQLWQAHFHVGVKGQRSTTVWKNVLKQRASELNPHLKVTLATADALLILAYGRTIV